ncbi:hypothetical protein B0H13DRAFT_1880528 [Mycena leptocephala]|nr:hypothetical protein B0H13DRAFT_1880528 [Mycena leptocephala]
MHGYKVHENYDPIWHHVRVPEAFLSLMCPDAESILEKIEGTQNLTGASNYWQMVIELRPYMFQFAAAIYQVQTQSALFKLPALQNPDVRKWMFEVFEQKLERRTTVLSPAKGYSNETYTRSDAETRTDEDTGLYEADDRSLRAFFCASPVRKDAPRPRTQVDLVLPPLSAFHKPGAANLIWPPIFGHKSVAWP